MLEDDFKSKQIRVIEETFQQMSLFEGVGMISTHYVKWQELLGGIVIRTIVVNERVEIEEREGPYDKFSMGEHLP